MDGHERESDGQPRSEVGGERDWARLSVLLRATAEVRYGSCHWTVDGREPTRGERELLREVSVDDLRAVALLLRARPPHLDGPPGDGRGSA